MKKKSKRIILIFLSLLVLFSIILAIFIYFYAGLYEFSSLNQNFEVSSEIKDYKVEADGISVHYRTIGEEQSPDLVFIHGWGGNYTPKDQVTTALYKQGFQVFTFEIPGLDRSDTFKGSWSNNDYANYFHKVYEKAGIKEPIMVGQSFGGGIAASYASLYKQDLKYLVLIDANTTDKDWFYPKTVYLLGNFFQTLMLSEWIPSKIKSIWVEWMLSVPRDQIATTSFKDRAVMGQTLIDTHTENQLKKLEQIEVPTLLIWGESDKKIPLKQAQEMLGRLNNGKLRTLPGGHTVVYSKPNEVAKIIKEELE